MYRQNIVIIVIFFPCDLLGSLIDAITSLAPLWLVRMWNILSLLFCQSALVASYQHWSFCILNILSTTRSNSKWVLPPLYLVTFVKPLSSWYFHFWKAIAPKKTQKEHQKYGHFHSGQFFFGPCYYVEWNLLPIWWAQQIILKYRQPFNLFASLDINDVL